MGKNLVAAIDIGSRAVRMKIGEINKQGAFRELDTFTRALPLGHNTFLYGKIDFDTVDMLCDVLQNYKKAMDEYKVDDYLLVATSAIREAQNRDYIVDQIRIRTGLETNILDNSEEQFITLKAIRFGLDDFVSLAEEGLIIGEIGGGSIQLSAYKNAKIQTSVSLKLGTLRIKEVLDPLKNKNLNYRDVLKEYIQLYLGGLSELKDKQYKHLAIVGGESDLICDILSAEDRIISKKDILRLYRFVEHLSEAEIVDKYAISNDRARVLFPSLILLKQFVKSVETEQIIVPDTSLLAGLLRNLYEKKYSKNTEDYIVADVLNSARNFAESYNLDEKHLEYVDDISIKIFNKMSKVHGLKSELLFLRLANILADVGKSISISDYATHTYDIVSMIDILGISRENMEMVALICKYLSDTAPTQAYISFASIPKDKHITLAKLIAILRLAKAIDMTAKQKIDIRAIRVKDKTLIITGTSKADTSLEEWSFERKAVYFKEVFGVDAILKVKKEF